MIIGYLGSFERMYLSKIRFNWLKYAYDRAVTHIPFLRWHTHFALPLGLVEFKTQYKLWIGIHQVSLEQADTIAGVVEEHLRQEYTKSRILSSRRLRTTKSDNIEHKTRYWRFERESYFAGFLEGRTEVGDIKYYTRDLTECRPEICDSPGCTSVEIGVDTFDSKANSRLLEALVKEHGAIVAEEVRKKYEQIVASQYDWIKDHRRESLEHMMSDLFSLEFPNRAQPYRIR